MQKRVNSFGKKHLRRDLGKIVIPFYRDGKKDMNLGIPIQLNPPSAILIFTPRIYFPHRTGDYRYIPRLQIRPKEIPKFMDLLTDPIPV